MSKKHKHEEEVKEEAPEQAAAPADETAQEDYLEQLVRLKAEFENYRKRIERERPLLIDLGKEKVIEKFLPLYDVMLKAQAEINKKGANVDTLKSGLEMVFKEMQRIFAAEGIKPIDCIGTDCNYELHDVLTTLPSDKKNDGKVVEEVQKGFTLNGKVLRHSKVCVGKCPEEAEEQAEEKEKKDEGKEAE